MIFDGKRFCKCEETLVHSGEERILLDGNGLWVVRVRGDQCIAEEEKLLCQAENFILGKSPLSLVPGEHCVLTGVRLSGICADAVLADLPQNVSCILADGKSCGNASVMLDHLVQRKEQDLSVPYVLLCQLDKAEEKQERLPDLVAEAISLMREEYMNLYGVEELSERLEISKSYLVRLFSGSMGITPGKYLTRIKLEMAKGYLLEGEYNLETIAGLCGFSGAHYLCRVFKKEFGVTPQTWRKSCTPAEQKRTVLRRDERVYL